MLKAQQNITRSVTGGRLPSLHPKQQTIHGPIDETAEYQTDEPDRGSAKHTGRGEETNATTKVYCDKRQLDALTTRVY